MKPDLSCIRTMAVAILSGIGCCTLSQVYDNFSDGNFTVNPVWTGDTSQFQITSSSAVPPEMKPALQLNSEGSDTSFLVVANTMMNNTEWQFWIKLSFNTSANNFARVYLVSDQQNLEGNLNGYFVEIGGAEDSIALCRQTGNTTERIIKGAIAFTGNSINVLRIKVTHDQENTWKLWSATGGGYNFVQEGTCTDANYTDTDFFGIYCKYTSSNATKFYFDDFYVDEIIIDTVPPEITEVIAVSSFCLLINFSEPVDIASAEEPSNYLVSNSIGYPTAALRDPVDFSLVHLTFDQPFNQGISYTLTADNISDLNGNVLNDETAAFQFIPVAVINPYDVVINEIMTDENPLPAGLPEADYLELFNRTDHSINLENCTLKPRESSDPLPIPSCSIEPGSFLIVTANPDVPEFEPYGQVVGLSGFSMNNEGSIVLRNPTGNLICSVSYTDEWYCDDSKKEGGWSIEQIDPENPCSGKVNWKASTDINGGTPGMQNSVFGITESNPEINYTEITSDNSVLLAFSHSMDSLSLVHPELYSINQGIGIPSDVFVYQDGFKAVILTFSAVFQENLGYNLTITDTIFDCAGNFIEPGHSCPLILPVLAAEYEIVINEIMADPNPPNGLPEYEYLELFNTTSSYLKMSGWTLEVGTSEKSIPSLIMSPGEYIIFTENEATDLFGMLARSFGFSSLGLTNSGTSVKLIDQDNLVISSVSFRDDWYNDAAKCEGGWSLEQIDPSNPCPGKDNWTASLDEQGGTPGAENSVFAINTTEPSIISVYPVTSQQFEVHFNQLMDEQSLLNPEYYQVDHGIGNPFSVITDSSDLTKVILEFSLELEKRKLYNLSLTESIESCIGEPVSGSNSFSFGIPETAEPSDVVINEVLFNPADDGVDFVEIINRSEKIINLKDLMLGTIEVNQFEPNDSTYKSVTGDNCLLLFGSYLVLTQNPDVVRDQYFTSNPDGFTRMISFPAYNNDRGSVLLTNTDGVIIDAFSYSEEMQFPLLNSFEGVSLERIHFDRQTQDPTNWHSASQDCGYATPGYKNSQFSETAESQDEITIDPEIFSPDNDGIDDIVQISYHFTSAGSCCSITIYDAYGMLTRTLINNELLGSEGIFSWDGRTNDNRKADIGIYIVYIETFDAAGRIRKFKKPVVIAGKL